MATGIVAFGGIMIALYRRKNGEGGAWVRALLLETALSLIGYQAVLALQAGVIARPEGTGLAVMAPYQAFRASDGWLLAGAPNDASWRRFAGVIGRPELPEDARFLTNQDRIANKPALTAEIEPRFATATVAGWVARFDAAGVACGPVQSLDKVVAHPQVLANEMVIEVTDKSGMAQKVLGRPFKFADDASAASTAAPALGQDTETVLRDLLGYDAAAIAALRVEDAV